MIDKHGNFDYSGGIPANAGDRYYSQDLGRDFNFLRSGIGSLLKHLLNENTKIQAVTTTFAVISGQDNLVIGVSYETFIGYVPFLVTIPNSWASLPPSTTQVPLEIVEVQVPHIGVFNLLTLTIPPTLNGITKNYIKVGYAETNLNSRDKVHGAGSYYSEKVPSYVLTADANPPTAYEICIATFTGNPNGSGYSFTTTGGDISPTIVDILKTMLGL